MVIFWHTRQPLDPRSRWSRSACIIPVCVGLARMYRGMHFFTDVVFGAVLGGASVIVTTVVLRHAADGMGEAVDSRHGRARRSTRTL